MDRGRALTSRIQGIDIDGQVHRSVCTHAFPDLLDNSIRTNLVYVSGFDNLEATVSVILIIRRTAESCSNPSVDVGIIGQQTFLAGVVEVCAVVDRGNLRWRAAENFGSPYKDVSRVLGRCRSTCKYLSGCQNE